MRAHAGVSFQLFFIFQYVYSAPMEEYAAMINVRRKNKSHIDSAEDLYGEDRLCTQGPCAGDVISLLNTHSRYIYGMIPFPHRLAFLWLVTVTLFNCSVGRKDCSRCRTADLKYGCVWCGGAASSRCVYQHSCSEEVRHTCPAPVIHFVRSLFFNPLWKTFYWCFCFVRECTNEKWEKKVCFVFVNEKQDMIQCEKFSVFDCKLVLHTLLFNIWLVWCFLRDSL